MVKKSIKKNYIYNVSYQILLLFTPLITTPYISRTLGADGVGTASYIESIMSYFLLAASMGMTTYGRREISYLQSNREERSKRFWEVKLLELFSSMICVIAYVLFAIHQKNSVLYLVIIFNLISVVADATWLFQGMEEFGIIIFRNIIFKILNIVYIFLIVHEKEDLVWYLFGISFFTLLSNLSLWLKLPQLVDWPMGLKLKPWRHINGAFSLFVPSIAIQVYTVLDKTMIGVITKNSFENGYYEQAIKIVRIVLTLITSLVTVMVPRVGYYFEQNDDNRVKQLMYRGYRFVWFLGIPLCLGLIMTAGNFVPWFFGEDYKQVVFLLGILSFLILAIGINNITGNQYLIPTRRQNIYSFTVIIGAVTNFILNIFLIRRFQAVGAAIASVLAETIIAIVQLVMVRKELSMWKIIKDGTRYYIAGILMMIVLYPIQKYLESSVIHTMVLIICGSITYFASLFFMKDEFFISNVKSVIRKIVKRK